MGNHSLATPFAEFSPLLLWCRNRENANNKTELSLTFSSDNGRVRHSLDGHRVEHGEKFYGQKETDRYTVLSTNDIPTFNSGGSFLNKYFNVKYKHIYFIITFKWT